MPLVAAIHIRLVIRPPAIHAIEIETRSAEIYQCIGIILFLAKAGGVEGEIVVDELAERVCVGRAAAGVVVVRVVVEDRVADQARVRAVDRRLRASGREIRWGDTRLIGVGGAQRRIGAVVSGAVDRVADHVVEAGARIGQDILTAVRECGVGANWRFCMRHDILFHDARDEQQGARRRRTGAEGSMRQ